MTSDHGTAAPQSHSLAAVGFTSSDGNMDRSKFKDQLIKKLTRTLTRLKPGRNKHNLLNGFVPASSGTQTGQQHTGIQGNSASGRIKQFGTESIRYVDFLAYQGYIVEILGGKHCKTPEGEFVKM